MRRQAMHQHCTHQCRSADKKFPLSERKVYGRLQRDCFSPADRNKLYGEIKTLNAKKAKNDEFYTQFSDIQKEVESYLEYNPKTLSKVVYVIATTRSKVISFATSS